MNLKKNAEDLNKSLTERVEARKRAKDKIEERSDLEKELNRLKKGDYFKLPKELELPAFQKNEEQREESQTEIRQEIEKQEEIKNDENAPSDEREQAP